MDRLKRLKTPLCITLFVIICFGVFSFLGCLSKPATPLLGYLDWSSYEIVDPDGGTRPFDPCAQPPLQDWKPGETLRFTGRLPLAEEQPDFYQEGYLFFEYAGLDLTVSVDGAPYFHAEALDRGQDTTWQQIKLPFPAEDAGKQVVFTCIPLAPENCYLPLYARFSSENAIALYYTTSANAGALSVGISALSFILICGVFLLRLAVGHPDWSLPVLSLALVLNALWQLSGSAGYIFFPDWLSSLLLEPVFPIFLMALLLLYLVLNRSRSFWRYLGWVTACAVPVLILWFLFLVLRGDPAAENLEGVILMAFSGLPSSLLYYLCIYLTWACSGISAYSLLRSQLNIYAEANALRLHNRLTTENYRQMEKNLRDTSILRHEWKNQLAALQLLVEQKDYAGLERTLRKLTGHLEQISVAQYSDNFTVNVILQNAAVRASGLDVAFHAAAPLPEELGIDESDLCSLLINTII